MAPSTVSRAKRTNIIESDLMTGLEWGKKVNGPQNERPLNKRFSKWTICWIVKITWYKRCIQKKTVLFRSMKRPPSFVFFCFELSVLTLQVKRPSTFRPLTIRFEDRSLSLYVQFRCSILVGRNFRFNISHFRIFNGHFDVTFDSKGHWRTILGKIGRMDKIVSNGRNSS